MSRKFLLSHPMAMKGGRGSLCAVLLLVAVAWRCGGASATRAAADACAGVALCAASSSCRAVALRNCEPGARSCVTGLCVLTEDVGKVAAPAIIGIAGATSAVTNSTPALWRPVAKPLFARTALAGCTARSAGLSLASSARGVVSLKYAMQCKAGNLVEVTETYSSGADGSAHWRTSLQSSNATLWTTGIGHAYYFGYSTADNPSAWFPGAAAMAYPTATYSPFSPWSVHRGPTGGNKVSYGSESGTSITVLGLASMLYGNGSSPLGDDTAISFVQDPAAFPYTAGLGVCGPGPGTPGVADAAEGVEAGAAGGCIATEWPLTNDTRASTSLFASWNAEAYRLGGDTAPVVINQDLLVTNSDWRAPYGWAVDNYPGFFDPAVNMTAVDGPGTYAHIGHSVIENGAQVAWDSGYNYSDGGYPGNPPLPAEYADLGVTLNWDASFPYQSHGNFIPYNLSSGEPFDGLWQTCFGTYNCSKKTEASYLSSRSNPQGLSGKAKVSVSTGGADPITDCHPPGSRQEAGGWTRQTIGGAAPCWSTSYAQINAVYEKLLAEYGISNCMYGNFWEYGFNVTELSVELHCDNVSALTAFERDYCETNLPLRGAFKHAWLPSWSPGKKLEWGMTHNGMDGSIVMDAANPAYHSHLLKMVDIMLDKVPASAGICIDGTASWTRMSPVGDDGRTLCGTERCHTQVGTFINTSADIAAKLHAAGKSFFWNPSQPRADMMMHFDGIFSELGYAMPQIALQALLTVNKPNVMWNAGCYLNDTAPDGSTYPTPYAVPPISYAANVSKSNGAGRPWQCASKNWKQPTDLPSLILSLQGSLHMGIMYSPPFPGADHSAYPYPTDERSLFLRYKPLFFLLKGKKWLLRPHALSDVSVNTVPTDGGAAGVGVLSNIFTTTAGTVVSLGFGPARATVGLTLSADVGGCPESATVYHAMLGATPAAPEAVTTRADGSVRLVVKLGEDGEAMLRVPAECR